MVYLHRIYTKGGDAGQTSLGDGTRVPKTHLRIRAYGGVDELNSVLGVALANELPEEIDSILRRVQNDLFDLGADLCVPESVAGQASSGSQPLRLTAAQVERLERWIDAFNERLRPLESFVMPGGTRAAANLHLARSVCRRVEIAVFELAGEEQINSQVAMYLNRLSDLLFVLARVANNDGRNDALWVPGGERDIGA
jgi:cob(I)alamin adenosyltransferase